MTTEKGWNHWLDRNPAARTFLGDRLAMVSLVIILGYLLIAVATGMGWLAKDFAAPLGEAYLPPNSTFWFGTDILGRDVFQRTLHGAKVAVIIGFISTGIAIPIGVAFGAASGYFRGRVDDFVVWFYTTFDSIPYILMVLSLALLLGKGLLPICIAIGITSWVGTCRVVRAEFIKQSELEYVQAARALGAKPLRVMFRHILPNVVHLILIQSSLIFVTAIKIEVVINYLGLGDANWPSWGIMINDARLELVGRGSWWQFVAATTAMFILLLAFNLFNDGLRDALDPKTSKR